MSNIALPTNPAPSGTKRDRIVIGKCAAAYTAGTAVVLNSSGLWVTAINSSAVGGVGILLETTTAANQVCTIQIGGPVCGFAALTIGAAYWLSATTGRLCPYADLVAGANFVPVGVAESATVLNLLYSVPVQQPTRLYMASAVQSDQGAGATVSLTFGAPLTGRKWVLRAMQVINGTVALATAQAKHAGTAMGAALTLVTSTLTSQSTFATTNEVAAGEALTVDLVTGASTGDLDAAQVFLFVDDLAA